MEEKKESQFIEHVLFGGALRIQLPSGFKNIEDKVPVPDTQEIFQDMSESDKPEDTAGCCIIEVLEQTE